MIVKLLIRELFMHNVLEVRNISKMKNNSKRLNTVGCFKILLKLKLKKGYSPKSIKQIAKENLRNLKKN